MIASFKDVLSPVRFWCGRFLSPQDGHDRCLTCLGIQHAEGAFVDGSCSSCGDMTISECVIDSAMSNLVCLCRDPAFVPAPGAPLHPVGVRGDLRITVRASPRGVPHPSSAPQPVAGCVGTGWDLCRAG